MQINRTFHAQPNWLANARTLLLCRAIPVATAAGLAVTLALSFPRSVKADDDGRDRACGNSSLRGDYGILVSGIRAAGPGRTETFVATALRTYDGNGAFTQIDNSHGQLTGAALDRQETGTYQVSADCSGTATLLVPGVPFPIESAFVIVDRGREVDEAVMSPQPNIVTAIQHRR
jgi:hypothetical protein